MTDGYTPTRALLEAAQRETTIELIAAAKQGDEIPCERLCLIGMPWITARARYFSKGRRGDVPDLAQAGFEGLFLALCAYNPESPAPFWPYASHEVNAQMRDTVYELRYTWTISERIRKRLKQRKEAIKRATENLSRLDLAAKLGIPIEELDEVEGVVRPAMSIEEARTEEPQTRHVEIAEAGSRTDHLIEALDETERELIYDLYHSDMTAVEVAAAATVTPQAVGKRHRRAIERMRVEAEARGWTPEEHKSAAVSTEDAELVFGRHRWRTILKSDRFALRAAADRFHKLRHEKRKG